METIHTIAIIYLFLCRKCENRYNMIAISSQPAMRDSRSGYCLLRRQNMICSGVGSIGSGGTWVHSVILLLTNIYVQNLLYNVLNCINT